MAKSRKRDTSDLAAAPYPTKRLLQPGLRARTASMLFHPNRTNRNHRPHKPVGTSRPHPFPELALARREHGAKNLDRRKTEILSNRTWHETDLLDARAPRLSQISFRLGCRPAGRLAGCVSNRGTPAAARSSTRSTSCDQALWKCPTGGRLSTRSAQALRSSALALDGGGAMSPCRSSTAA